MQFRDVDDAFNLLSNADTEEDVNVAMTLLERYVVLLYDRGSTCVNVNIVVAYFIPEKTEQLKIYLRRLMLFDNTANGRRCKPEYGTTV